MDTATIARQLGISTTAVRQRADKLGITPTEVSGSRGRPRHIWTEENFTAIRNFGSISDQSDTADWVDDIEQQGQSSIVSANTAAMQSIQGLIQGLDHQASSLEDRAASAIAARLSAIPHRAFQKAALMLQETPIGVDLAGFGNIPILPYARAVAGDRFPEIE
jgi:predicted ArsR family transcriptional regulator